MAYEGVPSYVDANTVYDNVDEPLDANRLLGAIKHAEKKFDPWQRKSDRIDTLYANLGTWAEYAVSDSIYDSEFNLFWASMEVVKPSIYSRPPIPIVTPAFKDRKPEVRAAAELLERCAVRGFSVSDIDQVMLGVRDDLAINARGVIWLTYESGKDSKPFKERVCIEHLDRKDFLHEPARKWADVGWVARRAWMTAKDARARFGEAADNANYGQHKDDRGDQVAMVGKAGFWEIWSKTENKVFWVGEGCDKVLDSEEPFLKLRNFFPCPRPAYGTLERRSLVPVPDIVYIEDQLTSINTLTTRIHDLCERLVVRGIIPAGTDVGEAMQIAMSDEDSSSMFIPVPAAAFNSTGKFIEWVPVDMVANAILAAVQGRRELIGNVQEILGIADIMRGETEAQETLGAQKLKAQFGSVRIRDKVAELVRISRDTAEIMSEIQADEFDFDTLLEMARMELPKKADNKRELDKIKATVKSEMDGLQKQIEQSPEAQQNPQAAQQQFQQQAQQIVAQYQPAIEQIEKTTTYEAVRDLLKDQKIGFADFDIQTDSTIYPDEQAEKASRNEYMATFASAATALAPLVQTGAAGARLAGELMKFQLGPYRAGREVDAAVDEWIESVENQPPAEEGGEQAALVEAQNKLAEAEIQKAKAATMSVEARAASETQKLQAKMFEMQQKAANDEKKSQLEVATLQGKLAEQEAKVNLLQAQTAEILSKIGLDVRKQDLEEYKTAVDTEVKAATEQRATQQDAMQAEGQAFDQQQRMEDGSRQAEESEFDREQRLRGEDRSDRQQDMSEQMAQRETGE